MSMINSLSVRMLYILVLCPVLLASVLTLTIDSQLGTSIEDCFERISIGEQLPSDAIYRNVSELTTKECEQICKQDKQCQTYDYGVGAKGNATCELSKVDEKELKEKNLLKKHPDYDVYVRRFQCEQSPPTPIQAEFDDPGNGLQHRPVFRPDADEKRPPDYPLDLRPYETHRPYPSYGRPRPSRPFNNYIENERPDDYDNFKPDYDRPPSYGAHKPQDIPYRPDRPSYGAHKPQDIPYRPERPHNGSRPDPYDVMQFHDPYGRPRPRPPPSYRPDPLYPNRPNDDIPDIYGPKPVKPELKPEHPQYVYIIRPNRRPLQDQRPQDDLGYNKPNKPNYPSNSYGQNDPGPSGPVGPPPRPYRPRPIYEPSRPNDRPVYSYNEQYASNYGANNYHDNSIYVEIYDPPRPYKPRPDRPFAQGTFGYGTQSFDSQYSQNAQSSHYGSSSVGYGQNRPTHDPKPLKPGYGQSDYIDNSYGSKPVPSKPNYSDQQYNQGYGGSSSFANQAAYGESQNQYGVSQGSYSQGYGNSQKGQSQGYGQSASQYGSQSSSLYGSNQASYGSTQGYGQASYGGSSISDSQYGHHSSEANQYGSYGSSHGSYGSQNNQQYSGTQSQSDQQHYGSAHGMNNYYGGQSQRPSYGHADIGYVNHASYGESSTSQYGSQSSQSYGQQSDFGYNRPSSNRPVYGDQGSSGYGSGNQGSYNRPSSNRPSYGSSQTSQDDTGYVSNNRPSSNRPSYGSSQTSEDDTGYVSNNRPSSNRPSYGSSQTSEDDTGYVSNNRPSSNRPSYGSSQTQDDTQSSYGLNQGSYNRPSSNRPYGSSSNQDDTPTGYGSSNQGYDKPSSQRPVYSNQVSSSHDSQTGYGSQISSSGYNQPSYDEPGYNKPSNQTNDYDRPDYKPVYETEMDKPGDVPSYIVGPNGEIVTSRPVAVGDYEDSSGYGRNPGGAVSYKACFRRVLAGRRALRSHVRKVLHCEHLEDCQRECALEKHFHCESFNYRLDPSFRGKGLCELMTKPIEAFNLHEDFVDDKDYDFFELDRNSLEPNCLDSLRGPGLLHSGYLSSKPSNAVPAYNRWSDRADWYGYRGYKYEDRRQGYRYSNRRYEDQTFVPYQIGIGRTNDDENWAQYGGVYGGYDTYYKDRNDYHKSVNHWRLADDQTYHDVKPYHGVKPYGSNTDFNYHSLAKSRSWDDHGYGYGAWKRGWSSAGAWNAVDFTPSKPPKHYWIEAEDRSDDEPVKDCSSRRRPGMSLGSAAIRRSLFARNVVECEAACFGETEFKCVSYSYRYSSSHGIDNCFLSERPYKGLDMSADSGSDVYAMPQDQGCGTVSRKPWIESECFWHVRSGAAVSGTAERASLTVTGLGACEAECIRAHAFFCRGFSFRFESPSIGDDLENCILTSTPPTSLDTGRGLRPTAGHELYARGNYGRGCEPALYDDVNNRDTQCYLKYDNAAKLTGSAVRGQAHVKDERACGAACNDAPFRCLSFSFRSNASPDKDNCLLSEIRLFDLQRGVDYEHSTDDWLFAFDLFNGQCWRKVHGKEHEIPSLEVPRPLSAPSAEEEYLPARPDSLPPVPETYIASSGPSGLGYPSAPELPPKPSQRPVFTSPDSVPVYKPSYLPESGPALPSGPSGPFRPAYPSGYSDPKDPYPYGDRLHPPIEYDPKPYKPYPQRPIYKPFLPTAPSGPGFKPDYPPQPSRPYPDRIPGHPSRPQRPIYGDREDNEIIASWRHYTVSGFPCRKGTTCAQNQVAGHWACEPEGGEIGSWDYCCAPTHRCGYSEGFQKPWCYVGPANDQWRPCSEKYYPYHQHKVPHPSLGHRDDIRPVPSRPHRERPNYNPTDRVGTVGPYLSEADRRYWDQLYKNGPQAYYDKYGNPLPGYTRVPTEERPYIKYSHNHPRPGSGTWVPVPPIDDQPPGAGELGVPRYWPVAYLHKGPPPNMTYFRYNETSTTTERYLQRDSESSSHEKPLSDYKPRNNNKSNGNDVEGRNIDDDDGQELPNDDDHKKNISICDQFRPTTYRPDKISTTIKNEVKEVTTEPPKEIKPQVETTTDAKISEDVKLEKEYDVIKGIDDKLHDFTTSIEIFDIEDAKVGGKLSDLKTVEAEEKQIEAIGRLLASRRGGNVVLEKRSQNDLESKKIAVDKDFVDFNFGNKFPTVERRGKIQKVSKDEIEKERLANDKSLEVSETTFVRPPRVLSTTENIRKAIINGKVFYDATIRDQRELLSNSTRKPKSLRLEESRGPSVIANSNAKKKVVRARNINPVRRVRRVYRKRYNPDEVRKRLLEREKSKNNTERVKA